MFSSPFNLSSFYVGIYFYSLFVHLLYWTIHWLYIPHGSYLLMCLFFTYSTFFLFRFCFVLLLPCLFASSIHSHVFLSNLMYPFFCWKSEKGKAYWLCSSRISELPLISFLVISEKWRFRSGSLLNNIPVVAFLKWLTILLISFAQIKSTHINKSMCVEYWMLKILITK